jgi:hypothetical protein
VIPEIRPPESSSTCSDQGSNPPPPGAGLYWANAGEPFASTGTSLDPRHPMPGPRHHARMSSWVCSQSR